ncbi:MAG: DUF2071 domain-containing protein [Lapillicoccus sp.]
MRSPDLAGEVERRLLVNYRVDPSVIASQLPQPFRPQVVDGCAVAGICLIRLGSMRPRGWPTWVGLRSENAAHRVAVEWDSPEGTQTGVYIPRRDSNSVTNVLVGGRLFPGEHHRADFHVSESVDEIRVSFAARDGSADVNVAVAIKDELGGSRLFADVAAASAFFERGSVGFSGTRNPNRFDGLALRTKAWRVDPAEVLEAHSSFFSDRSRFPEGSAQLDCALVMRRVPVTWEPVAPLRLPATTIGAP